MAKQFLNGIKIHYQVKGQGPDVILIHGITSSLAQWYTKVLPVLAQHYRVTMYDLRGHGLSDITETGYTSREQAGDLLALMDHLDIPQARMVGHSFGGAIGLHAAILAPNRVAGVVLLDTGLACLRHLRIIKNWEGWEQHGDELARIGITYDSFLELDRQKDISGLLQKSFEIPVQFGFRKGGSRASPRLKRLLGETRVGVEFREEAGLTEEQLGKLQAPVLALYGGTSPYQKMGAYLGRVMPNCRCDTLADVGHFYLMENPDVVLEHISGFLQDPSTQAGAPAETVPTAER